MRAFAWILIILLAFDVIKGLLLVSANAKTVKTNFEKFAYVLKDLVVTIAVMIFLLIFLFG